VEDTIHLIQEDGYNKTNRNKGRRKRP